MRLRDLPRRFCWTKFGTEAGEPVYDILSRKDRERSANGGVFLWGIGNSVGPGIRELVRLEKRPMVIFSPMRAKPKAIDTTPGSIVLWRAARTLDGAVWRLPPGSTVVSRAAAASGEPKRVHYALVCYSEVPIFEGAVQQQIAFNALENLVSGSPLGYSQVTSVVHRKSLQTEGPTYPVGFYASLVYPYFVELGCPVTVSDDAPDLVTDNAIWPTPQVALGFD